MVTNRDIAMNKKEVAQVLEEIGTILDLKGENPFKVRAYYNGARIVESLDQNLEELVVILRLIVVIHRLQQQLLNQRLHKHLQQKKK